MQKMNSQTGKVLKKVEANTILPYTDGTLKSKVTSALKNERIQDVLINYYSQGSRNSRT